jgi:cell division protein FtsL
MAIWATSLAPMFAPQQQPQNAVRRYMAGAPEIYFAKAIDNSRLVKQADPRRRREMMMFTVAMCVLGALTFVYLCQHFNSIEYGYKIEAARMERDQVLDVNKTLKLEEASLKAPERIDAIARSMGMQSPVAGQVQHLDTDNEQGVPVMARAAGVSVVSLSQ